MKSGQEELPGIAGAVDATAQRQRWSKLATMEKFVDHCSSFEHAAIINKQPAESLEDGCYVLQV